MGYEEAIIFSIYFKTRITNTRITLNINTTQNIYK